MDLLRVIYGPKNFVGLLRRLAVAGSKALTRVPLERQLVAEVGNLNLGRVLFVGSGGRMETLMRGMTCESFFTIDIDARRMPDRVMSVTAMDFPKDSFDTVFLAEVLDHVVEPWKVDEEIQSALVAGGRLIVTTPFQYPIHDQPHNYYRFTEFGLMQMFPSFEVVSLRFRAGFLQTLTAVGSRLVRHSGLAFTIGLAFVACGIVFSPLLRALDHFLPNIGPLGYDLHLTKKFRE